MPVTPIDDVTQFPEMMDGRVKTLHPRVHGGLLAKRDNEAHMAQAAEHGIEMIDMVVVNLYAFEKTVESGADFGTCIENIDIGGPSMLRSAAKNWADVTVSATLRTMSRCSVKSMPAAIRKGYAPETFGQSIHHTAEYDAMDRGLYACTGRA